MSGRSAMTFARPCSGMSVIFPTVAVLFDTLASVCVHHRAVLVVPCENAARPDSRVGPTLPGILAGGSFAARFGSLS